MRVAKLVFTLLTKLHIKYDAFQAYLDINSYLKHPLRAVL